MILDGNDFSKEIRELDQYVDGLPTKEGKLIAVLHVAQDLVGYLPRELQNHIALKLGVPSAKVYGVVTFYSFFTEVPKGEFKINICMGTACFVKGAEGILSEFKKQLDIEVGGVTADKKFSLDALRCVGACGLAPVVMVNEKIYGRMTPDKVKGVIGEYKEKAVQ